MKSSAAFGLSMGELPTGDDGPRPTPLRGVGPKELSNAIDVVASLTERAERIAGNGPHELAMSAALGATFKYLVAYFHHLAIDHDEPDAALAKAAAGLPDLGSAEMGFLRAISGMRPRKAA